MAYFKTNRSFDMANPKFPRADEVGGTTGGNFIPEENWIDNNIGTVDYDIYGTNLQGPDGFLPPYGIITRVEVRSDANHSPMPYDFKITGLALSASEVDYHDFLHYPTDKISITGSHYVSFAKLLSGNDMIEGSGGDDVLLGFSGDDHFLATGGFDSIDGGPGTDSISLPGEWTEYSFGRDFVTNFPHPVPGSNSQPPPINSPTGANIETALTSIERLHFSDLSWANDTVGSGNSAWAARILGSLVGKAAIADRALAGEVISYVDTYGAQTVTELLVSLGVTARLAGGADNASFFSLLYKNLMGTPPPASELAELVSYVDSGAFTQAQALEVIAGLDLTANKIGLADLEQKGWFFSEFGG